MKTPKIKSFLRLVIFCFSFLSLSYLLLLMAILLGLNLNFAPRYFQEKQDTLRLIKNDLLEEVRNNPEFQIKEFVERTNKSFSGVRIDFVPPYQVRTLRWRNQNRYLMRFPNGRRSFVTVEKMNLNGRGGFLILYPKNRRLESFERVILVYILFSLIAAAFTGFFIYRWMYRRTDALIKAATRVSRGDYQTRVVIEGDDEFTLISLAFNDMADSIEKYTKGLESIDLQRRQFMTDISHELSTPLTSIKGYLEILPDDHGDRKAQLAKIQIIREEAERLTVLVKQLLEMARIDMGTIVLEKERCHSLEFFNHLQKRNGLQFQAKEVEFIVNAKPEVYIYADYQRLDQIFQNLIDNALKHSSGLTKITVDCDLIGNFTRITFANNGSGIATEHLPHLFDRFYKGNSIDGNSTSSGLGLAIVKNLVELHGGEIEVSSVVDEGTTFTLKFPST